MYHFVLSKRFYYERNLRLEEEIQRRRDFKKIEIEHVRIYFKL